MLERENLEITYRDRKLIQELIKPIWMDSIDIKILEEIMEKIGIYEDYPLSNKYLNYRKLSGPTIRTFNKIIKYLNENRIGNAADLIPSDKIETIELISLK